MSTDPKFAIGGKVIVVPGKRERFVAQVTDVIYSERVRDAKTRQIVAGGWGYKTDPHHASIPGDTYWHEKCLRKLPPPADGTFDEIMAKLLAPEAVR